MNKTILNNINYKFPQILFIIYVALFLVCAINPYDRSVWFVENLPIVLIVLALVLTYKRYRFSNLSYFLMFFLIALHTIGGHFTFARVPFDIITNFFAFERNNFDRFAHFTVGFYAFAFAELLMKKKVVTKRWAIYLFPILFIMSIAAGYELFEWQFAVISDSSAGIEVLGSQGDIWDAQKDILADTLGALFSIFLFYILNDKKLKKYNIN
jgi:putative membrane protein